MIRFTNYNLSKEEVNNFFLSDPNLVYLSLADEEITSLHTQQDLCNDGSRFVGLVEHNCLVGMLRYEHFSNSAVSVHPYLKTELHGSCVSRSLRKKGRMQEVKNLIVNYFKMPEMSYVTKILVMVPSPCLHIHNIMPSLGLALEGTLKKCCKWRTEPVDILIYSLNLNKQKTSE